MAKKQVARKKVGTSWRLTPDALRLLDALSKKLGLNLTSVIEVAIRHLANEHKIE